MARSHELLAELLEVVDFTVEDDCDGAILVADRLGAARDVLYAEAPCSEMYEWLDEMALAVRSAVREDVGHRVND